jgi:hypothetical protein
VIGLPDYYIYGDPRLRAGQQTLDQWFNTSNDIWAQRPPDTLRTAKLRSPNLRRNTAPQFNSTLIRTFQITERHRFQLKISAFNSGRVLQIEASGDDPFARIAI